MELMHGHHGWQRMPDGYCPKRGRKHLNKLNSGEKRDATIEKGEDMSGTRSGAIKAAKTNLEKYGKNFYKDIGRKGGSGHRPEKRYFHIYPEIAKIAAAKGGSKSKRGKKNVKSNLG